MKIIQRNIYLDRVTPYIRKNVIKVLIGQRRVGKSFLLKQIIEKIKLKEPGANIIYINKELDDYLHITDNVTLSKWVNEKTRKEKLNYLFIDELQEIEKFEVSLRSFQAKGIYDIYCTGSNAKMLSGELATYLSGRYIEIKVNGLSYQEFLEFHELKNTNESLNKYLKFGGLPYLINLPLEDQIIFDYLNHIYAAILYKDLVARYNIRNVVFLENLIRFVSDNVGNLVSSKKISDFLKSQKISLSPVAVMNYLNQLQSVFFINKVQRSDITGKKIFEIGEKYYFEDLGIRNTLVGFKINDISKILENAVYLHLKIAGYQVYVGNDSNREIDFICRKADQKIYVQVCFRLTERTTIEREFGNLKLINDNYPKMVISLDDMFTQTNIDGIEHIHLKKFLSERVLPDNPQSTSAQSI